VYRALLVPELSIQTDQNSKYVLTVDAENTVRITPVTLGSQFGSLRAIAKGLNGDERVIVNGLLKARPGSKVQPHEAPMPGADETTLSTTRVIEPAGAPAGPSSRPTTAPSTQPAGSLPTAAAPTGAATR
jgi:hypothetical protein